MFHSYFRLHATIDTAAVLGEAAIPLEGPATARLVLDGAEPMQKTECRRQDGGLQHEVFVEALVDPARFPGEGVIEVSLGGRVARLALQWLLQNAAQENARSLFAPFKDAIGRWCAAHGASRPRLLDLGGRARGGVQRSEHYPECEVTTFDIVPDPGVDVVGDAHELSRHFPPESFEFAQSISVFEHLVMPWKAVVEVNRVLKPGGMLLIFTHQTIGMHDIPWDFFRFSDASWNGLFNRATGFEIVATDMSSPMHIVPRAWSEHYRGGENALGFEASAVIVRKTGPATVSWEVAVPDILKTAYPRG